MKHSISLRIPLIGIVVILQLAHHSYFSRELISCGSRSAAETRDKWRVQISERIGNYAVDCNDFLYYMHDYFWLSGVSYFRIYIVWQKRNNKIHDKLSWTPSNCFCELIAIRFLINRRKRRLHLQVKYLVFLRRTVYEKNYVQKYMFIKYLSLIVWHWSYTADCVTCLCAFVADTSFLLW